MNRRTPHPVAIAAALAAAVGLCLAPVPAHAAVSFTFTLNQTAISFSDGGPATCTVTNSGSSSGGPFAANGVLSTRSVSGVSTITDNGDATDVTQATATSTSKVRTTKSKGVLRIDWRSSMKATVDAAQGLATDCDVAVTDQVINFESFTVSTNTWMAIDATLPPGLIAQVILQRTAPASPPFADTFVLYGARTHAQVDFMLTPGSYSMTEAMILQLAVNLTPAGEGSAVANPVLLTSFTPAGTAIGKAAGPGGKYVKLKKSRSCATHSLDAKWKPTAGQGPNHKVAKATFFANGHKVKTVNNPNKGQTTKLKHLADNDDITIKARLNMVGGGAQTVSRTYLSCT